MGILLSLALMLGLMSGMSLTAYAGTNTTSYQLWVGGEEVTSDNLSGNGWSYEASSNTLTLNNFVYSGTGTLNSFNQGYASIYYTQDRPLIVELIGKNTLNVPSTDSDYNYGISNSSGPNNITFTGNGSLNIVCNKPKLRSCCISSNGNVVIEGPSLYLEACNTSSDDGIYCSYGMGVSIVSGSLTAKGGDRAVTSTVKNSIDGTGWTDTAGTTGERIIKAVTGDETSDVSAFKMVQFPVVYPLWVGDTQVTSANKEDVLGEADGNGATVSFSPATTGENATPATLTLNGADINKSYNGSSYYDQFEEKIKVGPAPEPFHQVNTSANVYYVGTEELAIRLAEGTSNQLEANASDGANEVAGIYSLFSSLHITGSGSLTTKADGGANVPGYGIFVLGGDITISGGTITAEGKGIDAGSSGFYSGSGNITIKDGAVTATGSHSGIAAANSVIISGGTVEATGSYFGANGRTTNVTGGTVTIIGDESAVFGPVITSIKGTGWTDVDGTQGKADIAVSTEGQYLSSYKKLQFPQEIYPLWVGGTHVTSANAANITGSDPATASYDAETKTLSLNGYIESDGLYIWKDDDDTYSAAIYAEDDLTIELEGENTAANESTNEDYAYGIYSKKDLTITGVGKLNTSGYYGIYIYDGDMNFSESAVKATGRNSGIFVADGNMDFNSGNVDAIGDERSGLRVYGLLTIDDGTVYATSTEDGICAYYLEMNDGHLEGHSKKDDGLAVWNDAIINGGIVNATIEHL